MNPDACCLALAVCHGNDGPFHPASGRGTAGAAVRYLQFKFTTTQLTDTLTHTVIPKSVVGEHKPTHTHIHFLHKPPRLAMHCLPPKGGADGTRGENFNSKTSSDSSIPGNSHPTAHTHWHPQMCSHRRSHRPPPTQSDTPHPAPRPITAQALPPHVGKYQG